MSTRLALRIQERFEKLAPSEKKLASLVLERQDDLLTYSATELAKFAGVSKATAARLFRSLGYRDFNDVRLQAREERNRTAPFERRLMPFHPARGARTIGAHLAVETAHLTRTFEGLRSDKLSQAAEILAQAPRFWLLGLGLEEGLARYGRLLFAQLRPDVQLLGMQPGAWSEDLAMTGPGDALLLVSLGPRPRIIRSILDYVATTRMRAIAVVDPSSTRWAQRFALAVFTCHGAEAGGSHTAVVSTLRLLAQALADQIGHFAARRADLIAEIREELEDEE